MDPATIIMAVTAASTMITQLSKYMEERRRRKELTAEEEAQWDAYVQGRLQETHWQPSTDK